MKNLFIAFFAVFFGVFISIFLTVLVAVCAAIACLVAYWRGLLTDIAGLWNPEHPTEITPKSIWEVHQEKLDAKNK